MSQTVGLWKVKLEIDGCKGLVFVLARNIAEAIRYGEAEFQQLLREEYGADFMAKDAVRVIGVKLDTEEITLGPCLVSETDPPMTP